MLKAKYYLYTGWQTLLLHLRADYRIPLIIRIILTNRCNNHCVYCKTHKLPQADGLSTEQLKKIMSEMKGCGTQRIHFTGGEPMLRKDLQELIAYGKRLDFFMSMNSNGYQIPERFNELKELDLVTLAYDGPAEAHNYLRYSSNVSEVESAIKALKTIGVPVWTNTVLNRRNVNFVEDIVEFAREQNIIANFSMLNFTSNPQEHFRPSLQEVQELVLGEGERKKCLQKLIDFKLSGAPIGSSLGSLQNILEWPYNDRVIDSQPSTRYKCWAARAFGCLDARGRLHPCLFHYNNLSGVDVTKQGFRTAWKKLSPPERCLSCLNPCGLEMNLLFSFNRSAIFNWLKKL